MTQKAKQENRYDGPAVFWPFYNFLYWSNWMIYGWNKGISPPVWIFPLIPMFLGFIAAYITYFLIYDPISLRIIISIPIWIIWAVIFHFHYEKQIELIWRFWKAFDVLTTFLTIYVIWTLIAELFNRGATILAY